MEQAPVSKKGLNLVTMSLHSASRYFYLFACFILLATAAVGKERNSIDPRIVEEATERSEVMELAKELTQDIGHRLTNSPNMRRAEQWAIDKFEGWGLDNVQRDGFKFGWGWELQSSECQVLAPEQRQIPCMPQAWSPGTNGVTEGEAIYFPVSSERDLSKLSKSDIDFDGKIVLIDREMSVLHSLALQIRHERGRYDSQDFKKVEKSENAEYSSKLLQNIEAWTRIRRNAARVLKEKGAKASITRAYAQSYGGLSGEGLFWSRDRNSVNAQTDLPQFELARFEYDRALDAVNAKNPVQLSLNAKVAFFDDDLNGYNILADIIGADPDSGYILAGAHMDSWAVGEGAADNAAGVAVIMEAARIIKALGLKPKRTIRFALWSGEEQGLHGSIAYARTNLGSLLMNSDRSYRLMASDGYQSLKAYFNLDYGTGQIRGIRDQGHPSANGILKKWMRQFEALDAHYVIESKTSNSDHFSFSRLGYPSFSFIQDPLNYETKLHHSTHDTFEELEEADLKKSAQILAALLITAANSDEEIARDPSVKIDTRWIKR